MERSDSAAAAAQGDDKEFIFEDLCTLQELVKMESDIKATFMKQFKSQIEDKLVLQIQGYMKTQLKFKSDLEQFRYAAQEEKEKNVTTSGSQVGQTAAEKEATSPTAISKKVESKKPTRRILELNVASQFTSRGRDAITRLFWYLWENKEVFDIFASTYLNDHCRKLYDKGETLAMHELLDLVVFRLFQDLTAQIPVWRVVEIQQRFIEIEIQKAPTVDSIEENPLLNAFFHSLTQTDEARRCINYLFKAKCERIDLSFLTMKNIQKVYFKYAELYELELAEKAKSKGKGITSFLRFGKKDAKEAQDSKISRLDSIDQRGNQSTHKFQSFLRSMFASLIDIADAIMSQLFEKVSVIPYAIRQFCKCLFHYAVQKFGKQDVPYERAILLVSHFLLTQWLLKACFQELHLEGLTKEFYLGAYCKKNLSLVSYIVHRSMTFQNWEVPTPASERAPGEPPAGPGEDLFSIHPDKKTKTTEKVKTFYKDLLQIGSNGLSQNVFQLEEQIQADKQNKFQWRMMCVNLEDIHLLLDFFREHVQSSNKGVNNLLDKIEYYNDEEKILEYEPDHNEVHAGFQNIGAGGAGGPCECGARGANNNDEDDDANAGQMDEEESHESKIAKKVKYFLFVKPPVVKDIKQKAEDLAEQVSAQDKQVRKHLLALLMEAETLQGLKITIMDQNSLSEIMSVIRQHIEKKKAFGQQDWKFRFVIQSIGQRFSRKSQSEARKEFQQFIKNYAKDAAVFMAQVKNLLMDDTMTLKIQEKVLSERIQLSNQQTMIVHILRKTKARSRFIQGTKLKVNIYKFTPNDHLELVIDGQKSTYAQPFEEFKVREAEMLKKADLDKQAKEAALNKQRPLQGNLALNFLFKDQDFSEIIKIKGSANQPGGNGSMTSIGSTPGSGSQVNRQSEAITNDSGSFRSTAAGSTMARTSAGNDTFTGTRNTEVTNYSGSLDSPTGVPSRASTIIPTDYSKIQGYYQKKFKYKVENVNDFVAKLRKAAICYKFFSHDNPDYAGIKQLFRDFYLQVQEKLENDPLLCRDLTENMEEISEYVMFNLHAEFFYNTSPSEEEIAFQKKCEKMERLDTEAYGVPIDEQTKHTWKSAVKEAAKIEEVQTPRAKLQQLGKAIEIIQHTFELYKEEQVCADDLVQVMPYILVKARIQRLLAHFNYIDAFHFSTNDGDQVEVYKTNLKIAVERIKDFVLPGEENKKPEEKTEDKEAEAMGAEFEMQIEESKNTGTKAAPVESKASDQVPLVGRVAGKFEDQLAAVGMNFDDDRFNDYRTQDISERNSTNFIKKRPLKPE